MLGQFKQAIPAMLTNDIAQSLAQETNIGILFDWRALGHGVAFFECVEAVSKRSSAIVTRSKSQLRIASIRCAKLTRHLRANERLAASRGQQEPERFKRALPRSANHERKSEINLWSNTFETSKHGEIDGVAPTSGPF